jgi:excisionase family DNA binding protein
VSLRERNTIGMVAEHWGVSTRTVRRLVDSGELPALRIGGSVRLTRQAIEVYEANAPALAAPKRGLVRPPRPPP